MLNIIWLPNNENNIKKTHTKTHTKNFEEKNIIMKKINLIKLLVGASALAGTSATVMSCGSSTTTDPSKDAPTVKVATAALNAQLSALKSIKSPTITGLTVNDKNVATGKISYNYATWAVGTFKDMNFSVQLTADSKKVWTTADVSNLINAPYIGRLEAKNDTSMHSNIPTLLNNKDADLKAWSASDTRNPIKGWVTKNPTQAQRDANKKLVTSSVKNNVLTVSFPSFLNTVATTDGAIREAYNFNVTKSYDLTKTGQLDAASKATISNTNATLTEATKVYMAAKGIKTLPADSHFIVDVKNANSWTLEKFSKDAKSSNFAITKTLATATFDASKYPGLQWTVTQNLINKA